MTKIPVTLIDWYIAREEKELLEKPESRPELLKMLKEDPEGVSRLILSQLDSDMMHACMEIQKPIMGNYTLEFARSITDGLKKHFIGEEV